MKIQISLYCVYYNFLASFYILLNTIFPYYSEEILNLQYKTIENINDDIIFENNARKRKRFNIFIDNLINKNNELIQKIRQQEEEDNNLNNYEKIDENENEDDVESDVSQDDDKKNN